MPQRRMVLTGALAVGALGIVIIGAVIATNLSTFVRGSLLNDSSVQIGAVPARPLTDYEPASDDAVGALVAALAAGDDAALPAAAVRAKNALMGLTVPADARAAHLALILALSRFEQDPSPEAHAALAAAVEAFSR